MNIIFFWLLSIIFAFLFLTDWCSWQTSGVSAPQRLWRSVGRNGRSITYAESKLGDSRA